MTMALWVVEVNGRARLARGTIDSPSELLAEEETIDRVLGDELADGLASAISSPGAGNVPPNARILAPIGQQDVWAAGVTYRRSRDARMSESRSSNSYDRVYGAARPELFFKSTGARTRGPSETIGVRADSGWDVPEPELAVVVNRRARIVGYTIGNDVSSRRIEGENTLYLPQAKIYTDSCALGPCLVPIEDAPPLNEMTINLTVHRNGRTVYADEVHVADMYRKIDDLVRWLYLAQDFPYGAVLMTGTAIVPDDNFTLRAGDSVSIAITGLGVLMNPVEQVGGTAPPPVEK